MQPKFVSLKAGQQLADLTVEMTPRATISGRVVDEYGDPVKDVFVQLETVSGGPQIGSFFGWGNSTDDLGAFHMVTAPGRYYLHANNGDDTRSEIRTDGTSGAPLISTYYPSATSRGAASVVEAAAGQDVNFSQPLEHDMGAQDRISGDGIDYHTADTGRRGRGDLEPAEQLSGIDVRLIGTPNILVSGKVTGVPDKARAHIQPNREEDRNVGGWPGSLVKADGTFTIANLDPGKYTLVVTADGRGPQRNLQSAPVEIEVAGNNIEHLELRMIAPFEVTGQIRFDDAQIRFPKPPAAPDNLPDDVPPPSATGKIRLLKLNGGMLTEGPNADVDADDSFTLEKVTPGRYRVMLELGQSYVRSVRAGATETEGDILDVGNGLPGELVVSVSSLTCEISGTVNDTGGPVANAHVVLVPDTGSGLFSNSTSTKSDGTYLFTGVPPGKFKLAVTEDELYMNFAQPGEALEDYKDVAESIELHPGDKLTKDLKRK